MNAAAGDAPLLRAAGLRARYGDAEALHGVDFTVGAGEVIAILGANGAGKTTTLRAVSQLVKTRGDLTFGGVPLNGRSPDQVMRLGIAHVPQGRGTLTDLSVHDNLRAGAYIRRGRQVHADIDYWYTTFPRLAQCRGRAAGGLSGGEQQMLAIARALMSRPRLLLLDEPSLGLAPVVVSRLFDVLRTVHDEWQVEAVIVEQNAAAVLDLATRGYVLEAGEITMAGSAASLREDESVRESYLGYLEQEMPMANSSADDRGRSWPGGRSGRLARNSAVAVALLAVFSAWAIHDGGLTLYLQRVIDGAANGMLVAAVAISLVVVFKATRVINFAQGAMATLGTFAAYTAVSQWSMPTYAAVIVAMLISAAGAAVIERALIRPLDPANHLAITLIALSLFLAISAVTALIWGFNPRGFPSLFPAGPADYVSVDGARLRYQEIGTAAVVLALVALLWLLLARTRLGLAFRCVANNIQFSQLVGISVGRTVQIGWAVAAAVGTLAGCLYAQTTYLDPNLLNNILVYAFAAATFGGLDSIGGAVVGGLVVDLAISLLTGYIPALGGTFELASAFIVIILVLQFKPAGLFGRRYLERV